MFLSRFSRHDVLPTTISFIMHQESGHHTAPFADHDAQLLADCHAMAATKKSLLLEYEKSARCDAADQDSFSVHIQQLVDEVDRYGRRISATRAVSSLGLQNKGIIVGLLLAELTDDPSTICDRLLLSLLNDFDDFCARIAASYSDTLKDYSDNHLIEACRIVFIQIEEVRAECIRVGEVSPSQELKQSTKFLMTLLMNARRSLIDISGIPATSIVGCRTKGSLLRRMMAIGEADVHHKRLALARSFVADIAGVEPHPDVEDGIVGSGAHWWTNLTSKLWRLTGATTFP